MAHSDPCSEASIHTPSQESTRRDTTCSVTPKKRCRLSGRLCTVSYTQDILFSRLFYVPICCSVGTAISSPLERGHNEPCRNRLSLYRGCVGALVGVDFNLAAAKLSKQLSSPCLQGLHHRLVTPSQLDTGVHLAVKSTNHV